MTALDAIVAFAVTVIWMGAYAQLLGMPIAWLRLRKTPAWRQRPDGARALDLLAGFIAGPTVLAIAWGWLVLMVAAAGGLGLSGVSLAVTAWGAPLVFVPWAVLRLDTSRLQAGRASTESSP